MDGWAKGGVGGGETASPRGTPLKTGNALGSLFSEGPIFPACYPSAGGESGWVLIGLPGPWPPMASTPLREVIKLMGVVYMHPPGVRSQRGKKSFSKYLAPSKYTHKTKRYEEEEGRKGRRRGTRRNPWEEPEDPMGGAHRGAHENPEGGP